MDDNATSVTGSSYLTPPVQPSEPRASGLTNSKSSGTTKPSATENASHRHAPSSKQIKRRNSQPILTWLQRKIAGNKHVVKRRQAKELSNSTNVLLSEMGPSTGTRDETVRGRKSNGLKIIVGSPPKAESASGTENNVSRSVRSGSGSGSFRPGSTWSTRDGNPEADDDASIRPLPPTSPPSPVPSRSTRNSSSNTSDPRTQRSIGGAPSTKPTTLMSIEFGAGGHIAQVPSISSGIQPLRGPLMINNGGGSPTPDGSSPISTRFAHATRSAPSASPITTSISFSPLPASPTTSRSNTALTTVSQTATNFVITENVPSLAVPSSSGKLASVQAPSHTQLHPRNNPRPASPPPDNASTLTLASSTFALSTYASPSRAPASVITSTHYGGRGGGNGGEDAAASVRALRPTSRRGSWGSDETGWSATGLSTHSAAGPILLGGISAAGRRRPGAGSIATARSAWSYRGNIGGTGGTLDQEDENEDSNDQDDNEEGQSRRGDDDDDDRTRLSEITPTEEGIIDLMPPTSPIGPACSVDDNLGSSIIVRAASPSSQIPVEDHGNIARPPPFASSPEKMDLPLPT